MSATRLRARLPQECSRFSCSRCRQLCCIHDSKQGARRNSNTKKWKATYEKEVVKYNQHAKVAARVHVIGIEGNNSFKLGCRELGLVPFQKFRSFACVGFDVLLAVRSRLR